MTSRILKIDYPRVAAHLCSCLAASQDPDTPPHQLTFEATRGILNRLLQHYTDEFCAPGGNYLTEQKDDEFSAEVPNELEPGTKALTEILFQDLGKDSFEDASVSNYPGAVIWNKETPVLLPLVLITVS